MKIFYSNGDSVVWGAELENKQTERIKAQKQFVSNLPDGVTAESIQYYTQDEIENVYLNL